MEISGQFKSLYGDVIRVEFSSDYTDGNYTIGTSNDGQSELFFSGDNPVVIETETDDEFEVIIKKSARINLVTKNFVGGFFFSAGPRDVIVRIYRNGVCLFDGFVVPNTYSQDYKKIYDEFEINCVDYLSTIEYYNYKDVNVSTYFSHKQSADTVSFSTLMSGILPEDATIEYDNSKGISDDKCSSVFDDLGVSSLLFFGDEYDDIWTQEDVLKEVLQYLNLHIIQEGSVFKIFDWETVKKNSSVDISKKFMSKGVQISMGDVYSQVSLTCEIEDQEDLIESPLDSDTLYSLFNNKIKYMSEYISEGEGRDAINAFKNILSNQNTDFENAKRIDWYMQPINSKNWKMNVNHQDITNYYWQNNGQYYGQYNVSQMMIGAGNYQILPAMFGLGSVENNNRQIKDGNNTGTVKLTNYLCISLNGNSADSVDSASPSDSRISSTSPIMEYIGNTSGGVFSPADEKTTNYIVFSGTICLLPIQKMTDTYTNCIDAINRGDVTTVTPGEEGGDDVVTTTNYFTSHYWHKTVPSDNNDDGRYYTRKWYKGNYPNDIIDSSTDNTTWLDSGFHPLTKDKSSHLYQYNYTYMTDSNSYDSTNDQIKKLPILACELIIGDKRLIETDFDRFGNSKLQWVTVGEEPNGVTTFSIGIDPDLGDYIIGDEFSIANNITMNMNLDVDKGMAVPILKSDSISGKVTFRILGPYNATWNDVTRVHPTWFRHTKWSNDDKSILAHCSSIIIKDFKCEIMNDNAGNSTDYSDTKKDLIYISNETNVYFNKKDDITFRISTQLTTDECADKGISNTTKLNSVINMSSKQGGDKIYNANTKETAKAEEHYVDYYYREYRTPKIELDVRIVDGKNKKGVSCVNNYSTTYSYPNLGTFFTLKQELYLKDNLTRAHIKEIG